MAWHRLLRRTLQGLVFTSTVTTLKFILVNSDVPAYKQPAEAIDHLP
jgi:hypothetical protein